DAVFFAAVVVVVCALGLRFLAGAADWAREPTVAPAIGAASEPVETSVPSAIAAIESTPTHRVRMSLPPWLAKDSSVLLGGPVVVRTAVRKFGASLGDDRRELVAARHTELRVRAVEMALDRADRHAELDGDLGIRPAARRQPGDLALAARERRRVTQLPEQRGAR